jgi:acetylornithine deacetylase
MEEDIYKEAIILLKKLISIPSFSEEENLTAKLIGDWFDKKKIVFERIGNNLWAKNKFFDQNKPTILLNSHHDTVKPNKSYTKNPFNPIINDGKLYGLGSNDAGGALVSLISTFSHFYEKKNLKYNIIIAATAEEEIAGKNSIKGILNKLPEITFAIIGEPTLMELAIAEKGLIVFDGIIRGTASHAAHDNNDSAINKLPGILNWFKNYEFEKYSNLLGSVKTTVTQINAGSQHNVIPSEVEIVVDVRVNELYSNQEIVEIFKNEAPCEIIPRSLKLESSSISINHEIIQAGLLLGKKTYGSPTLSDQASLRCPSLKLGPGDSKRSHIADEFIYVNEINEGVEFYIKLLNKIL